MKKTRFYIVRHGESEGNVDLAKAEYDPSLTQKGKDQAKRRASDLQGVSFNAAYSSNLKRAVETTEILIEGKNIPYVIYEDLRERGYGAFFSHPSYRRAIDEIVEESNNMSVYDWWQYQHPEGKDIEPYAICFGRFYERLASIAPMHRDETVLLVSHGDLMRSLLVYSNFGDHKQIGWEAILNTGYIILDMEEQGAPNVIKTVDIIKTE